MDSRNNCGNRQSQELRGPGRRHYLEETSGRATPRTITSPLCSKLHREPQFPEPTEELVPEMAEIVPVATPSPPVPRESIPVPDTLAIDYSRPADTSCTSSDVSVQDPTLQTSTPEKLKRRYPLRERKSSQRFYSFTRITRTVYMRFLHQLTLY